MGVSRAPADLHWAFLVLEGHPYGREMLARLLQAGFVPRVVIEECSEVASVEREKFEARMAGFPLPPSIPELLAGRDVARVRVESHNDDACEAELAACRPELLVLGGTRILRPRIFMHAREGALNSHPGLLPEVRGSASVAWAIHLDLPVGCTCHFIEAGIDTGPIAARREIAVRRGDTYEKLCHATTQLSAILMVEALTAHVAGTLVPTPQGPGGPAHKNMPDAMVAEVRAKLALGRYLCIVE